MKKIIIVLMILAQLLVMTGCEEDSTLPAPELEEGMRGELGIDKNINENSIDHCLGRSDSVYRDMRMLKDEANYELIGGDSYLSGFVEGFEVVPYPYICNVEGLPAVVGNTYSGETLFTHTEKDGYVANYEESMHILESLFPHDKYIFLMCGGGGYAGMMRKMLIELGWDENRIYNVGGFWYYEGQHAVSTKYEENGVTHYDFSIVPYHLIDFSTLKKIGKADPEPEVEPETQSDTIFKELTSEQELNALETDNKDFVLYVYLPGCASCVTFYPIVQEFARKYPEADIYAVKLNVLSKTANSVSDRVKYTPSLFIYKEGQVLAYLDPGSKDDLRYYSSLDDLSEWYEKNLNGEELTVNEDENPETQDCLEDCTVID